MQEHFVIEGLDGARTLRGTIPVRGAKNAIVVSMPAVLLFEDSLTFTNVPDIEDVARICEMLLDLGFQVERTDRTCTVSHTDLQKSDLHDELAKRLRASIVFAGPLLGRFGRASFPHPGGDIIGPRPIDLFIEGFKKMGCSVSLEGDRYTLTATGGKLKGADIFFRFVSVTGTETLLMAAVLAEGTTVLRNAAMEPEVVALANFLIACGAQITGAGTPTITIVGGPLLQSKGKEFVTMPDRIEAGSFLILAALAGEEITITDCNPEHIEMLIELLRDSGVDISVNGSSIMVRKTTNELKGLNVRTHEYPGFATDLQPPMLVYLTQTKGESTLFETIYGGRLNYTKDLLRMGAKVTLLNPQQVTVMGPSTLTGCELESPDIRAGLAFVMSAAIAKGTSTVGNIYHVDRGYEKIEERLSKIGLTIKREKI